jgi:hypothetical protein
MDYFSSIWFKLSFWAVVFMSICDVVLYFLLHKKQSHSLLAEERIKLSQTLSKAIWICKMVIFLLPLYIFIVPPIRELSVQVYYQIIAGLTVMYAGSIGGFVLFKKFMNSLR